VNDRVAEETAVPPSVRRARRAVAARHLLALHADGALEDASRWDWDTLGELPSWCLLGERERRTLQCVAGLVFLGPELRLMVDGEILRVIGEEIGEEVLEHVLDDAASRFDVAGADAVDLADDGSGRGALGPAPDADDADDVTGRLLGTGASVLYATLGERLERVLPLGALREAVGPSPGTLDRATAERVLANAEASLAAVAAGHGR